MLAASGMAQSDLFGPTGGQNLFSIGGSLSSQTIDLGGASGEFTTTTLNLQAGDPPPVIVPVPMLAPKPGFAPAEPAVA